MFNYGSPVMNNMYQQQMMQPMMPQPISNMVNMAPGYNMGTYYSGMNTGYYNPYLIQQQQKQMEAQRRQNELKNADTFKLLSRNINKGKMNEQQLEEHVKQYDPDFVKSQRLTIQQKEDRHTMNLMSINNSNILQDQQGAMYINYVTQERQKMQNKIPDNMGLSDFFEVAGEDYIQSQEQKMKQQQKQVNRLYNQDMYKQLVGMHKNSNMFNSTYNNSNNTINTSINNEEIPLPSSIAQQMEMRKMQFLSQIGRG